MLYIYIYISNMKTLQIGNCQIWGKIMNIASNRVHMARFGPIIAQNRSHRLWGASGMPPGPQNPPKNPKILGLGGLRARGVRPPYFPCVGKLELLLQGVVGVYEPSRGTCLRMLREKAGVANSPTDPGNPTDQVSGGAVEDLPSARVRGQDDMSSNQFPSKQCNRRCHAA